VFLWEEKMKIVIMAGGKGTRIASLKSDIPKPMITICGKPILDHQIECFRRQGFTDIILVIGHLGNRIKDYFKNGDRFGVNINYIEETTPLGTAGALFLLKEKLIEDFLLINGDLIFDIDIKRFLDYHKRKAGLATLFTHPNNHPYDSAIIKTDDRGKITDWLHKEDERYYYKNRVNAGLHLLSPEIFGLFTELKEVDLDRDVLKPLISSSKLYAYDSPEYVKDMGTPERYHMVSEDIEKGKVSAKNLQKQQKAIFLDRDGTINKYKGFITNADQIELIEGVPEAIRKLNLAGYLVIIVTNQPVIARGDCGFAQIYEIHNKIETMLGEKGAYVDNIFFCPHHPEKGFVGELIEYKGKCDCRKPKPGMLLKAADKYNISLTDSYIIGDDMKDVQAGLAAGCRAVLLTPKELVNNCEANKKSWEICENLLSFTEEILGV